MENWKDIKGYEGYYQVSNLGRIKSLKRTVCYSNGKSVTYAEKIRKSSNSEYRLIALSKDGNVKMFKISRIVANHFLNKVEGKYIVNHIDGNKHNDHVENLEYVTTSENIIHAFENGLIQKKNKISGIFYDENRKRWCSYLYRNNKNIFLGRFLSENEAIEAREKYINEKN